MVLLLHFCSTCSSGALILFLLFPCVCEKLTHPRNTLIMRQSWTWWSTIWRKMLCSISPTIGPLLSQSLNTRGYLILVLNHQTKQKVLPHTKDLYFLRIQEVHINHILNHQTKQNVLPHTKVFFFFFFFFPGGAGTGLSRLSIYAELMWMDSDSEKKIGPIHQTVLNKFQHLLQTIMGNLCVAVTCYSLTLTINR